MSRLYTPAAVLALAALLPGCRSTDPIVGSWQSLAGPTKLVWVFEPDGNGRNDVTDLETQLRSRLHGRPMPPQVSRMLEEQRNERFTWKREGAVYRLAGPNFEVSPLGRVMFVNLEGNQLRLSSPDGKKLDQGIVWTRVPAHH
jgi:hypothetical protein